MNIITIPGSYPHAGRSRGLRSSHSLQEKSRAIVTQNKKDFILLHNEYTRSGKAHSGIVVADQLPIGLTLRRFMKLWFSKTTADMANSLEFLSNWKRDKFLEPREACTGSCPGRAIPR